MSQLSAPALGEEDLLEANLLLTWAAIYLALTEDLDPKPQCSGINQDDRSLVHDI